jgi:hypothetical protein
VGKLHLKLALLADGRWMIKLPVKPQDARDYERSLGMGNATSDGAAGKCISAWQGGGNDNVLKKMLMYRCTLADRQLVADLFLRI